MRKNVVMTTIMFWLSRDFDRDSVDLWMDKPPVKGKPTIAIVGKRPLDDHNKCFWISNQSSRFITAITVIDAKILGLPIPKEGQLIAVSAKAVVDNEGDHIMTTYDTFIIDDLADKDNS